MKPRQSAARPAHSVPAAQAIIPEMPGSDSWTSMGCRVARKIVRVLTDTGPERDIGCVACPQPGEIAVKEYRR
jgi:hypothetical protein